MEHASSFSNLSGLTHAVQSSASDIAVLGCSACLFSTGTVEVIRYAFGIFGNIVNMLLYTAPLLTFKRIIRNKSTEEFSVVPYVAALLNSVLYTLYGSPLASQGWENLPLMVVSVIMAPIILFCFTMLAMSLMLDDHSLRKTILGSFGFFASASMYSSPLVAVKLVLETKSVEYMPFNLSLFSFLTSFAWMTYGLLGNDVLLASPSFIGVPLGILQLVVYGIYRKNKGRAGEPNKVDIEKNEESNLTDPLIVQEEQVLAQCIPH
ncbi:hypothetical protein IFM89_032725 [Coptis chinensis]|uniref:Bidirectional sugar transporter SWEET n=1 Tax=Coptis chinensis TaxID=261450 RepID=A0A835LTF8_9MAGN|nr:hypothetical protein IFM89_032725 [Coptis chinensis]